MEISSQDWRWMKMTEFCVRWWAVVLAVLNLCILYQIRSSILQD
jgi:hypothetical protein